MAVELPEGFVLDEQLQGLPEGFVLDSTAPTQPEPAPDTFDSRWDAAIDKRVAAINRAEDRMKLWQDYVNRPRVEGEYRGQGLNPISGRLQQAGQYVGGGFDILGEGAKSFYNALPESVKDNAVTRAIGQTATTNLVPGLESVTGIQTSPAAIASAIGSGVEAARQYAPDAVANIEAVANIIPVAQASGAVMRGAGKAAVRGAENLATPTAIQMVNKAKSGDKAALQALVEEAKLDPTVAKAAQDAGLSLSPSVFATGEDFVRSATSAGTFGKELTKADAAIKLKLDDTTRRLANLSAETSVPKIAVIGKEIVAESQKLIDEGTKTYATTKNEILQKLTNVANEFNKQKNIDEQQFLRDQTYLERQVAAKNQMYGGIKPYEPQQLVPRAKAVGKASPMADLGATSQFVRELESQITTTQGVPKVYRELIDLVKERRTAQDIDNMRMKVGNQLTGGAQTYIDSDTGTLKKAYALLSQDFESTVGKYLGAEEVGKMQEANRAYQNVIANQEALTDIFGKNLENTMTPFLGRVAEGIANQDISKLNVLLKITPSNLQKDALGGAIQRATEGDPTKFASLVNNANASPELKQKMESIFGKDDWKLSSSFAETTDFIERQKLVAKKFGGLTQAEIEDATKPATRLGRALHSLSGNPDTWLGRRLMGRAIYSGVAVASPGAALSMGVLADKFATPTGKAVLTGFFESPQIKKALADSISGDSIETTVEKISKTKAFTKIALTLADTKAGKITSQVVNDRKVQLKVMLTAIMTGQALQAREAVSGITVTPGWQSEQQQGGQQ